MTETTGPVTIGDLRREGKRLWIYCVDCGREIEKPAKELPQLADDVAVPDAGKRFKCRDCGGRRIQTKPQLYETPIGDMRKA